MSGCDRRERVGRVAALLVAAGVVIASAEDEPRQAVLRGQLEARLGEIAARLDGVMGYALVDLTSGERLGLLEEELFPAASTIKLAILYEFFRQTDAGTIRPDEPTPLDGRTVVGGSGILKELSAPSLSLRDHATLMIVLSDNTAANVLIDTLGLDAVATRLAALGLRRTSLRRRMMDLEAARRGEENLTTPRELAALLELIYRGEGLSASSRDAALAILKKPKASALVRGVPPVVEVAGKDGWLEGVRADAAVVFAPKRPYVLAVMTGYLLHDDAAERAIEAVSRAAYAYFARLGASTPEGRRLGPS